MAGRDVCNLLGPGGLQVLLVSGISLLNACMKDCAVWIVESRLVFHLLHCGVFGICIL